MLPSPAPMDLRPLRHRDYRSLYAAQFVSFLGSMVLPRFVGYDARLWKAASSLSSVSS